MEKKKERTEICRLSNGLSRSKRTQSRQEKTDPRAVKRRANAAAKITADSRRTVVAGCPVKSQGSRDKVSCVRDNASCIPIKNRRETKRNRRWTARLAVSFCLMIFGISLCSVFMIPSKTAVVEANQPYGELRYKVIEIKSGDTLWEIAGENMSAGFEDIYALISEIRRCNQLKSCNITAGHYLMIPFYDQADILEKTDQAEPGKI